MLWMAVTADKYELPLAVEATQEALAKRLGVASGTVGRKAYNYSHGKARTKRTGPKSDYWVVGAEEIG